MDVGQIVKQDEVVFGNKDKRVYGRKKVEFYRMGRTTEVLLWAGYGALAVGSAVITGMRGFYEVDTAPIKEGVGNCFHSYPAFVQVGLFAVVGIIYVGRGACERGYAEPELANRSLTSRIIGNIGWFLIGGSVGAVLGGGAGLILGGAESSAGYLIGRAVGTF